MWCFAVVDYVKVSYLKTKLCCPYNKKVNVETILVPIFISA